MITIYALPWAINISIQDVVLSMCHKEGLWGEMRPSRVKFLGCQPSTCMVVGGGSSGVEGLSSPSDMF